MELYSYISLNSQGVKTTGLIAAPSRNKAIDYLKEHGLTVLSIEKNTDIIEVTEVVKVSHESEEKDTIGSRIALARNVRSMSQSQLAQITSMSSSQISRLESGETDNPSLKVITSICQALNLDIAILVNASLIAFIQSLNEDVLFIETMTSGTPTRLNTINTASFLRNAATMVNAGMEPSLTFQIIAENFDGHYFDNTAHYASLYSSLSQMMSATGLFTSLLVRLVKIGEDTGNLALILADAATFYEEEVRLERDNKKKYLTGISNLIKGALQK